MAETTDHIVSVGKLGTYHNKLLSDVIEHVSYDATNKKLTKTAGTAGDPEDIVTVATLKTDMQLNNVGNFKAVSTVASQGLSSTEKSNARANIGAGTSSFSGNYNDLTNKPTIPTVNNAKFSVKGEGTEVASTTANASSASSVDIVAGSNVTVTPDATNNKITIAATDTTYSAATTSAAGLMSAADKTKLDGIEEGAQANSVTGVKGGSESSYRTGNVNITKANIGLSNVTNDSQVKRSEMGVASGVATLDTSGKVPSSQLPSYVDDVIEGYFKAADGKFYTTLSGSTYSGVITGEAGKIYVDLSTNKTYRWGGSAYVVISETLALGETSSTAYRGDRGKIAYDHSQATHARTDATAVASSTTNGNIKINGEETTVYTHPTTTAANAAAVKVGKDAAGHVVLGNALTYTDVGAAPSSTVSCTSTNVKSALGTGANDNTYLRKDGFWGTPAGTYSHPTGDGSSHVPATGTTNNGKVLMAGSTANSASWQTLPAASTTVAGITLVGASGGAATYGHTHATSIAASTATNQITLAHGSKYAITAGGTSYVFTMPASGNTDTKVTSAANHYTPTTDANGGITATLSGEVGAYALNTEYTVLTGITATTDAKGHVTGISYTAQKIKDTNSTYTVGNKALKVSSNSGTATQVITMNESSADRTLQIKGDGTYITGAVSGSSNAAVVTLSHAGPGTGSALTTSNGTAENYTLNTEYTVLTGVTVTADAKGHITGVSTTRQKIRDTNTTYSAATTSTNGLMSFTDKTNLDTLVSNFVLATDAEIEALFS